MSLLLSSEFLSLSLLLSTSFSCISLWIAAPSSLLLFSRNIYSYLTAWSLSTVRIRVWSCNSSYCYCNYCFSINNTLIFWLRWLISSFSLGTSDYDWASREVVILPLSVSLPSSSPLSTAAPSSSVSLNSTSRTQCGTSHFVNWIFYEPFWFPMYYDKSTSTSEIYLPLPFSYFLSLNWHYRHNVR